MQKIALLVMTIHVGCCVYAHDPDAFFTIAPAAAGCSVFTVSKSDEVFFGGNDDYTNPDSYYWVDPAGKDRYGVIWIGEPDNVQQGINDQGFAHDANGLPRIAVNPHLERAPVSYLLLIGGILSGGILQQVAVN